MIAQIRLITLLELALIPARRDSTRATSAVLRRRSWTALTSAFGSVLRSACDNAAMNPFDCPGGLTLTDWRHCSRWIQSVML
jgi:hypothetical protein